MLTSALPYHDDPESPQLYVKTSSNPASFRASIAPHIPTTALYPPPDPTKETTGV